MNYPAKEWHPADFIGLVSTCHSQEGWRRGAGVWGNRHEFQVEIPGAASILVWGAVATGRRHEISFPESEEKAP